MQYTTVKLVKLSDLTGKNLASGALQIKKAKRGIVSKEPILIQKKVEIKKLKVSKVTKSKKKVVPKKVISPSPQPARKKKDKTMQPNAQDEHLNQKINDLREKMGGDGGSVTAVASGLKGGVGIGNIPEMAVYTSIVIDRIMESWFLPPALREKALHQNLLTIIDIRIDRNGTVTLQGIEHSSKTSLYDDFALAAINKIRSESFPPLPAVFRPAYLDLGIRFYPSNPGY